MKLRNILYLRKYVRFNMNKKQPKATKFDFDFISLIRKCLNLMVKPETTEKDINQCANQFKNMMEDAQKYLSNIPGLDMTEEEQNQRIEDLKEAIRQKQHLIDECTNCFETWDIQTN